MRALTASALLLWLAAACGDGTLGPGSDSIAGVDLVLDSVTVLWPPGQTADPASAMHVASPGDTIAVRYVVRNRGDRAAPATAVLACIAVENFCAGSWLDGAVDTARIPALEPGARATGRLKLLPPLSQLVDDTVRVLAELDWATLVDDPVYANDRNESHEFIAAVPQFDVVFTAPYPEMRVGMPYEFVVDVTNRSPFAGSPETTVSLCMADFDICNDFAELELPALGPLGSETVRAVVTLGQDAIGEPYDVRWGRPLYPSACIGRGDPSFPYFVRCWGSGAGTDILPNLDDACDALLIAPDTTVAGLIEGADCRLRSGPSDAWAFDALAHTRYTATVTAGDANERVLRILDDRGEVQAIATGAAATASFVAPAAGRYHVTVGGAGGYTLALRSP